MGSRLPSPARRGPSRGGQGRWSPRTRSTPKGADHFHGAPDGPRRVEGCTSSLRPLLPVDGHLVVADLWRGSDSLRRNPSALPHGPCTARLQMFSPSRHPPPEMSSTRVSRVIVRHRWGKGAAACLNVFHPPQHAEALRQLPQADTLWPQFQGARSCECLATFCSDHCLHEAREQYHEVLCRRAARPPPLLPHGAVGERSGAHVADDGEHGAHMVWGADQDGAAGRRGREQTELEEMSPQTPQFPVDS